MTSSTSAALSSIAQSQHAPQLPQRTAGFTGSAAAPGRAPLGLAQVPGPVVGHAVLPLLAVGDVFRLKLVSKDFNSIVILSPQHNVLWQLLLLRATRGEMSRAGAGQQHQDLLLRLREMQVAAADVFRPLVEARLSSSLPVPHAGSLAAVRGCIEMVDSGETQFLMDPKLFASKESVAWSADDTLDLYFLVAEDGTPQQLKDNLRETETRLLQLSVCGMTGFPAPECVPQSLAMSFTDTHFTASFVNSPREVFVWGHLPTRQPAAANDPA